ncbi:MAG: hypothetical protein ACK5B9_12655, partial [Flavobacteriia bacterium]
MENKHTYKNKKIILGIFLVEVIFWLLFVVLLWFMDYFSAGSSDGQFAFKDEEKLWNLLLLLPFVGGFLWYFSWKNKRLNLLGEERVLALIVEPINSFQVLLRYFFLRNAFVFLILALAQPIFGTKKVSGTMESMELVVAIDVSNS